MDFKRKQEVIQKFWDHEFNKQQNQIQIDFVKSKMKETFDAQKS